MQGVLILGQGTGSYSASSVETGRDGTFNLRVLAGSIEAKVYVQQAGHWLHLGWYGEGGFVTDRSQATVIEVDDGDVIEIQIRLPEDPADLTAVEPPRVQGTVLGPDGEPLDGLGVWVWVGSTDNSKLGRVSADGTFDIAHQNGTFVLRIYTWKDEAWDLLGYYGEGGFTPYEARATSIEVDGADVGGIEIRLPGPIQGTVLASDGQPAEGISLWLWDDATDDAKFVGVSSDGTFDVLSGDGTFTLRVYTRKDEAWHLLGYYGEGGFTPDEAQAAAIEVDGTGVSGIEIRLPGRIEGTVHGPDGAPVEGIVLWLRDEVTGNTEFVGVSADGTFDIVYGRGTFTLRIYTLEVGVWRHIGWYGEGGFTADRDQATVIEVDGADVTGIEIRLPADPADLPTVR